MASAQAPTNRPVWLIVLALAMLLFGSLTLVEGLLTIRDPKALARLTLRDVAMTASQEEVVRRIAAIDDAIIARHRTALRLNAGFSIAFGLWTLYATAAVLSRDRNGRMLALTTAVLGTAHRLAVLPLVIGVAREAAHDTGPLLAELAARAGGAGASLAEVAQGMESRLIVSAAVGIGWWLLVFFYFGGRRGRELYGLPPR
jgi:hypothetical protein